ncbi:MAG TPA: hypothetical protein VGR53_03235 [Nitrososphaerales archaeon]|nr:hypothetical protein [Nitrososphaerales archaeon]
MEESESSTNTVNRSMSITIVSVLFLFFGLGIAVSTPFILGYIIRTGTGPIAFGIEFLHGNTLIWDLWGFNAGLVLGLALGVVSALEAVAGFWLWQSLKKGGKLGITLQIPNLFFAVGFAIPLLYVLPPVTTVLIASKWKNLR